MPKFSIIFPLYSVFLGSFKLYIFVFRGHNRRKCRLFWIIFFINIRSTVFFHIENHKNPKRIHGISTVEDCVNLFHSLTSCKNIFRKKRSASLEKYLPFSQFKSFSIFHSFFPWKYPNILIHRQKKRRAWIYFSIFSHDTFVQSKAMFPFQSTHIFLPMATVLTSLRLSFIALNSLWNASSEATKLCINSTVRVFKSLKELFPTKVGVVNRVQSI